MRMSTGFSAAATQLEQLRAVAPARDRGTRRPRGRRRGRAGQRLASRGYYDPRLAMDDAEIAYDAQGLVPCVIQDWRTGEVLTLAYMNAEALARTRATGELHLWSRSRDELWHKGATSRQHPGRPRAPLRLRRRRAARPRRARRPRLPHRRAHLLPPRRARARRAARGAARAGADDRRPRRRAPPRAPTPRACSPTRAFTGEKVEEEAEEVARAAREETDERVAEEAADVLYHLAVLLRSRGLALADAEEVLRARRR